MDIELLTFAVFKAFTDNLQINGESNDPKQLKKIKKAYDSLDETDKIYYSNYALSVAESLINTVGKVKEIIMCIEEDDLNLLLKKKSSEKKVVIVNSNITINNIIPEKLWNICGYRKNTNFAKQYISRYDDINCKAIDKISEYATYSEISDKIKSKYMYLPVCSLVAEMLNNKRKCAKKLYDYIFNHEDIYVKAYKVRYCIYDFSVETDEIESVKIKQDDDSIDVEFNNGAKFFIQLKTNSSKIRARLSLKFITSFKNIDEMFLIESKSV